MERTDRQTLTETPNDEMTKQRRGKNEVNTIQFATSTQVDYSPLITELVEHDIL